VLVLLGAQGAARAADFYVDPAAGAPTNDGSAGAPWSTLERVIADGKFGTAIQAGDTVWLRSGYHGPAVLRNGTYAPPITIAAAAGATPQLQRVSFQQTQGWVLAGVEISPSFAAAYAAGTMVSVDGNSSDVEVRGCRIFSVADASGWTADQWINTASSGVDVSGDRVAIRNCLVRNVRFGISVTGADALIEGNQVVNFSADGLRGLGDYGTFQYNEVKNIYVDSTDGDDNHDDGFQSWSVGPGGVGTGEVVGVVLRGNLFISTADPGLPFRTSMQGIGCFDGFFTDWIVENNVVITDHWHGISFYGMRGGRIVNNTVIDVNTVSPGPPWIMVTAHKDGTPSENVVVRNNLSTDLNATGTNVTSDHNTVITMAELGTYFVDPAVFDLHLLATAPAVNAGSPDLAPALDRDGIPRPQGAAVDLGAYEWHDPSVEPVDGGPPPPLDGGLPFPDDGGGLPPDDGGAADAAPGPEPDAAPVAPPDGAPADGAVDAPARDGPVADDAAAAADGGSGPAAAGALESGCGCRAGGAPAGPALFLLLGALLPRRRRRWAPPG
jgi:MYXO-CTERM domain-containing protein